MARISIMDICDGIAATFHGTMVVLDAGLAAVPIIAQSYDQLTEGLQDTPTVQVIPDTSLVDASTDTDRTTFKGCIKHGRYQFEVTGYARQRSQVDEDMAGSIRLWDALEAILEEEGTDCAVTTGTCTFFGVPDIKGISWSGQGRVALVYGGVQYIGCEVLIVVEVF